MNNNNAPTIDYLTSIFTKEEEEEKNSNNVYNEEAIDGSLSDYEIYGIGDNYPFPEPTKKLPHINSDIYKKIHYYANKNYAHGMELKNCIEFEIVARDKDNVLAIKDAIKYYIKHFEIIKNYFGNKLNFEDKQKCIELTHLLSNLKLVEFKYYEEKEKFEHWSINPFIYEIINYFKQDDNPKKIFKVVTTSSKKDTSINSYITDISNRNKFYTTQSELFRAKAKETKWVQSNRLINNYTLFTKKIFASFDYSSGYKRRFIKNTYNEEKIVNKIIYQNHYPKVREHPTLNIEIDFTANKDVLVSYLKEVINDLDKIYDNKQTEKDDSSKNDLPVDIFALNRPKIGKVVLSEQFYYYDYYIYRKEHLDAEYEKLFELGNYIKEFNTIINNGNNDKYYRLIEESKFFKHLDEDSTNLYFTKKDKDRDILEGKSTAQTFLKNIAKKITIKINKTNHLIRTKIVEELLSKDEIRIKSKKIIDNINSIKELVEKSKTTPLFYDE